MVLLTIKTKFIDCQWSKFRKRQM